MIAVYLKAGLVCAGHQKHKRVGSLHPPIDSLLLHALTAANVGGLQREWTVTKKIRWSKLNSNHYATLIFHLRTAMNGRPLRMIEAHLPKYQWVQRLHAYV